MSRKRHVFENARHAYGIRETRACNHTVTGQASTRKISNDGNGATSRTIGHTYMWHVCIREEEQRRWMNLVPGRLWCTKGKVTWYTQVKTWYAKRVYDHSAYPLAWKSYDDDDDDDDDDDIKNCAPAWKRYSQCRKPRRLIAIFFIPWQSNRSPESLSRVPHLLTIVTSWRTASKSQFTFS